MYWLIFFILLEIFLVLGIKVIFNLNMDFMIIILFDSESYLNILFQLNSIPVGEKGRNAALLLSGRGRSLGFPIGFHWHSRGSSSLILVIGKNSISLVTSIDTSHAGRTRRGSPHGLHWHHAGLGGLIITGWWWKSWLPIRPLLTAPQQGRLGHFITARWEWR